MKTIRVFFTKPKHQNPFSWAIQRVEGVDFSHVVLVYYSQDFNQSMVIQAKVFNTHIMTLSKFLETSEVVKEFYYDLSETQFAAGMRTIAPEMGSIYAYVQLFFTLLKRWAKIVLKIEGIGNFCTEIMGKFLVGAGVVKYAEDTCELGMVEAYALNAKYGRTI